MASPEEVSKALELPKTLIDLPNISEVEAKLKGMNTEFGVVKNQVELLKAADPNGMIVDRKSIEKDLQNAVNEFNQRQGRLQQLKMENEKTLDELAIFNGMIRAFQKILVDNPVANASSLQTAQV